LDVCIGTTWTALSSNTTGGGGLADRIVSGSASAIANQDTGVSVSVPLDVAGDTNISGTVKVAGTGSEPCDAAHYNTVRIINGVPQVCRQ
jgi:hypothetical protein